MDDFQMMAKAKENQFQKEIIDQKVASSNMID